LYSKLLNEVISGIMDFNRAVVIHGFLKTLLCFLQRLHKGACLLSSTKNVVRTFLNLFQVVLQGQVQWFNRKFVGV